MKKLLFIIVLTIALVWCNNESDKDTKTNTEKVNTEVGKDKKTVDIAEDLGEKSNSEDIEESSDPKTEVDQNLLPEKIGKYTDFYDMTTYAENIVIVKIISDKGVEDGNHNYEVKITEVIKGSADQEGVYTLALISDTEMGKRDLEEGSRALLMYNSSDNEALTPMEPELSIFTVEKNKLQFDENTAKLFRAPKDATLPLSQVIKNIKEKN